MTLPMPPLVLIAFDRPAYFGPMLASLAAQEGPAVLDRPVFLFLDGARNRFSGQTHARQEDIDACASLFRRAFPHGHLFAAAENLGVWGNFDRAERFVFERLGHAAAYFFEDDMVLSPHYLAVMDALEAALRTRDDIACWAAYGQHQLGLAEQEAQVRQVTSLRHNWAFGLRRDAWRRIDVLLAPMTALLRGCDYRQRPVAEIRAWLASQGVPIQGSSQDHLKAAAATLLGYWRLQTLACWGRYIGEQGLHFGPALYRDGGYGGTLLFPRPQLEFDLPSRSAVASTVAALRALYALERAAP